MALLNVLSKQSNMLYTCYGFMWLLSVAYLFNHRIASGACKPSPAFKLLHILPRPAVNPFFKIGQPVLYRNNSMKMPAKASYVVHTGRNTAWIVMGDRTHFVSAGQLHSHDAKMLLSNQDASLFHLASTLPVTTGAPGVCPVYSSIGTDYIITCWSMSQPMHKGCCVPSAMGGKMTK